MGVVFYLRFNFLDLRGIKCPYLLKNHSLSGWLFSLLPSSILPMDQGDRNHTYDSTHTRQTRCFGCKSGAKSPGFRYFLRDVGGFGSFTTINCLHPWKTIKNAAFNKILKPKINSTKIGVRNQNVNEKRVQKMIENRISPIIY
jgi:hypothetical protein